MHELLTSVAEVSIAIAGFAGLFVAFSGRDRSLAPIERYALLFLLFSSLSATLLALLPYVLMAFYGADIFAPWYCLFSAVALIVLGVWSTRSGLRRKQQTRRFPWARRTLMPVLWIIAALQLAPMVVPINPFAVYSLALWWLVLMAVVQFVIQIAATRQPES